MPEIILEEVQDQDFGPINRKKYTSWSSVDGGALSEFSYETWEGKVRSKCGQEFDLSMSLHPGEITESMRGSYRSLLADLSAVKLKVAAETVETAQDWAESAYLELQLDAKSFADALQAEGLSIENNEKFVLVLVERLGIFDGQCVMATLDADLNVSNAHIAG